MCSLPGGTGLRLVMSHDWVIRLRNSPVLGLLPNSGFMAR